MPFGFPVVPEVYRMKRGVLGGERLRRVVGGGRGDDVVPPEVAALRPLHLVLAALDHEHVLDGLLLALAAVGQRLVHRRLQRGDAALAVPAVRGDDELGAGVVDPGAQAVRAEPAEDDRVDGAHARHGEHRGDRLGDHRQIDRDAVALPDAETLEHVRDALDLVRQLGVGDAAAVAGLALPEERDAVAVASLDVPVEAVVGHVELAVVEPLGEGRVAPVEDLGEGLVPVHELARLIGPEALAIRGGALVELFRGDGLGGELLRRREAPGLVEKVIDLTAHRQALLCGVRVVQAWPQGECDQVRVNLSPAPTVEYCRKSVVGWVLSGRSPCVHSTTAEISFRPWRARFPRSRAAVGGTSFPP